MRYLAWRNGFDHSNDSVAYLVLVFTMLIDTQFWSGISPGDNPYGFTPTAQRNPFAYFLEFTESGQASTLIATESECSIAWYTNYTSWLATAPLTYSSYNNDGIYTNGVSGLVPASTVTSVLLDGTDTFISYGSTTATATETDTVTYLGGSAGGSSVTFTNIDTWTSYGVAESTSLETVTAHTETIIYTAYSAYYYPSYDWKAQAPCCSACTIYAGDIEVMYFPPATAAPNATATSPSTVVNSAGFTL